MRIKLVGEQPFLRADLRISDEGKQSELILDLSELRFVDTLTVVGTALAALRARHDGKIPLVILPRDHTAITYLGLLGLFDVLDPKWIVGTVPGTARASPEPRPWWLTLARLDAPGAGIGTAERFISSCTALVAQHVNKDLPLFVGRVLVEVIENAIDHSRSAVGTYAAAYVYGPASDRVGVEVAVGDAGVGVLATLRQNYPRLANSGDALGQAFTLGVSGAPSGDHKGAGLSVVHDRMHRLDVPKGGLVFLSGDGYGHLKGCKDTKYKGPLDTFCPHCTVGTHQFETWGTWVWLRILLTG